MVPKKFGPYGQMVPKNFGPPGQMIPNQFNYISESLQPVPLDKRNILVTISLGGPNWLGTICPWGSIVEDQMSGDQMSGDHMRLGPNVSQPL